MGGIVGVFSFYSFHFIKQVFAYLYMYVYEHVWVFIFWLYCISCTYRKRKKLQLLPSCRPPSEIKISTVLVKISWKAEIELSPQCAISYETRVCLKYLMNDCRFFRGWASFQHGLWKFCNIHCFLFQLYEHQNAINAQKRQPSF